MQEVPPPLGSPPLQKICRCSYSVAAASAGHSGAHCLWGGCHAPGPAAPHIQACHPRTHPAAPMPHVNAVRRCRLSAAVNAVLQCSAASLNQWVLIGAQCSVLSAQRSAVSAHVCSVLSTQWFSTQWFSTQWNSKRECWSCRASVL